MYRTEPSRLLALSASDGTVKGVGPIRTEKLAATRRLAASENCMPDKEVIDGAPSKGRKQRVVLPTARVVTMLIDNETQRVRIQDLT